MTRRLTYRVRLTYRTGREEVIEESFPVSEPVREIARRLARRYPGAVVKVDAVASRRQQWTTRWSDES